MAKFELGESQSAKIWDEIAEAYRSQLDTKVTDIHFGVGIPGNSEFELIKEVVSEAGKKAVDIACGSGENLVALTRLGYEVTGIDASAKQLSLARELLCSHSLDGQLRLAPFADLPTMGDTFDVILSVGALHFCNSMDRLIAWIKAHSLPGTQVILAAPHPIDMCLTPMQSSKGMELHFGNYFPSNNQITDAYYWRKFAGRVDLLAGLKEYLQRPVEIIDALSSNGFNIERALEPKYSPGLKTPCKYREPSADYEIEVYSRIPLYFIVKATLA